jgi:protein arginine kinase activator
MNVCQYCGKPATIHLTDILQKKKRETHLCEDCARAKKILPKTGGAGVTLNLQALVQIVLGQQAQGDPEEITCPDCGISYADFRAVGRLGCANDYTIFEKPLEHLLGKVHRATEHSGKMPLRHRLRAEMEDLQHELKAAIASEDYERAAALRDRIRQKEGN